MSARKEDEEFSEVERRASEEESDEEDDEEYAPSGDDSEQEENGEGGKRGVEEEDRLKEDDPNKKARIDKLYEDFKASTVIKTTTPPPPPPAAPKVVENKTVIFAGEKITVPQSSTPAPVKRPAVTGGFGAVLSQIGKKEKMSVLSKSKLDWQTHVEKTSEREDFDRHHKDGYLERTAFLQRTDVRQHEAELARRRK